MEASTTPEVDEVVADTPEAKREQALRSLKKRRDFKTHAVTYLLINCVVWTVWAIIGITSHSWWPWPIFVTFGWGIGLTLNAWDVYLRRPITEAELLREMERLSRT